MKSIILLSLLCRVLQATPDTPSTPPPPTTIPQAHGPAAFPYLLCPVTNTSPSTVFGDRPYGRIQYSPRGVTRFNVFAAVHIPLFWRSCKATFYNPTTNPSYKYSNNVVINGGNPGYDPAWQWQYQTGGTGGASAPPVEIVINVYQLVKPDGWSNAMFDYALNSTYSWSYPPPGSALAGGTKVGTITVSLMKKPTITSWTMDCSKGGTMYFGLAAEPSMPYYLWWESLNWVTHDPTGAGDTGFAVEKLS